MNYSANGLLLTENSEGLRLNSYADSGGVWTIGYGHTKDVNAGLVCTKEQAQAWLKEDTQAASDAVNKLVKIPLKQNEFDALVDFVFNIGIGAFEKSTLLENLNAGDIAGAARQFPLWDRCKGNVLAGLLRRRVNEQKEFQT